jgi:uncharacterized membrane protein YdbT with pleckstrin-like domain
MALDTDSDEEILIDTRPSWLASLNYGFIIFALLVRYGNRLTVTNKRVYKRKGIIRKNETFIRAEDIRDINIKQGFQGRIFRYGTVNVSTAGQSGAEISFSGVGSTSSIRDTVNEIRRSAG